MTFVMTTCGAVVAVSPSGRPQIARTWFSNWLVAAPSIVQCPELCRRAAVAECLGHLCGKPARRRALCGYCLACGEGRGREDAAAVGVLCAVPEPPLAVAPAHEDHRELGGELDETLVDRRCARQADRIGIACGVNAPLAFAVVAVAPRLEDARRPDAIDRGGEFLGRIDRRIGRRRAA